MPRVDTIADLVKQPSYPKGKASLPYVDSARGRYYGPKIENTLDKIARGGLYVLTAAAGLGPQGLLGKAIAKGKDYLQPFLEVAGLASAAGAIKDLTRGRTEIIDVGGVPPEIPEPVSIPIPAPEPSGGYSISGGGVPVGLLIPSGITSALGQQTPAVRSMMGMKGVKRRRKKKGAAAKGVTLRRKKTRAKAKSGSRRKTRLVKGSAAAKAWGAKMRRLRKKG